MDGLDCSEIFVSKIEKNLFRIEAEYFQKKYQAAEKVLINYGMIQEYKKKIECGPFGSNLLDSEYTNSGVLVVRPFNLVDCTIENERLVYISEDTVKRNNLKKYSKGALLFSRVGDIKVGYANKDNYTISPNIIIAELGDEKLSKYASVFFNTYYGKIQIERQLKVAAQPTISTEIISKLKLPIFNTLLEKVVNAIDIKETCLSKAQELYVEAEQILKEYINLDNIDTHKYSVKSLSESFLKSGRLDSEYYQDKYRAYEHAIVSAPQGYTYIKDEFSPVKEKCQRNLSVYNYVEIGDVEIGTGSASFNIVNTNELPDNAKIMTMRGDIIVSTVRPNRGAVAILENNDLLVSGAFTVLRESGNYPKEALQVLLRTTMYKDWLLRFNVGTSYPVIKDEDVFNMPIPLLEDSVKQDVVNKVKESISLRAQAKQLLEYAKQTVEMSIEQNEGVALKWLESKLSNLEV